MVQLFRRDGFGNSLERRGFLCLRRIDEQRWKPKISWAKSGSSGYGRISCLLFQAVKCTFPVILDHNSAGTHRCRRGKFELCDCPFSMLRVETSAVIVSAQSLSNDVKSGSRPQSIKVPARGAGPAESHSRPQPPRRTPQRG